MVTCSLQASVIEALKQAKEDDVAKERSKNLRKENEEAEENLRMLREQLADLQAKIAAAEEAHRARKEAMALEVEPEVAPDGPDSGISGSCEPSPPLTLAGIIKALQIDEEYSTQKVIDDFDVSLFDDC